MYKRRSSWQESYSSTTKVSIHWSNKSSAYAIKFNDTRNWNQMQILIQYIKNIPMGERDYDPDNKIWYLIEKYIEPFKEMVTLMAQYFELDFMPKPTGQTNMSTFVPVDIYLERFKILTGQDIKNLDAAQAKKIYRQWMMKNHPDKGGDHVIVRDVNECWSNLELNYFKSRKEVEYV